ncbi:MAG: transposase [Oscillospiraceae bacterium]
MSLVCPPIKSNYFYTIIVSYPKPKLQEALSIDEFKGNTWGEKYQCIITDPVTRVVLDILPSRQSFDLTGYFKSFPLKEREKVKFFVSDMWRAYFDIADVFLKNANRIVDKYHCSLINILAYKNRRQLNATTCIFRFFGDIYT